MACTFSNLVNRRGNYSKGRECEVRLTSTAKEIADYVKDRLFSIDPKHLVREEGTFYLSEILYCASKLYFNVKSHSVNPPNAPMIRGRLFHEMLPTWLADHPDYKNAVFEERTPIYTSEFPPFKIRGRSDIVISHGDIVDEWKFGEKSVSAWDMGIASYLAQASEYAYAGHKREARLYYMNMRTFEVWFWQMPPSQYVHDMIVAKANRMVVALHNNKIPDFESPIFEAECHDCPYSSFCPNFLSKATPEEQLRKETLTAQFVEQSLKQYEQRIKDLNGIVQNAVGMSNSTIKSNFPIREWAEQAGFKVK